MLLAELISNTNAVLMAATALLTVLLTKGVDAAVKWAKARHEMESATCHEEDERADAWAKVVIQKLDDRVTTLEAALRQSQTDHRDCERKHERLQGKVDMLENDRRAQGVLIVELQAQISKLQVDTK